jgi:hypothetical protein
MILMVDPVRTAALGCPYTVNFSLSTFDYFIRISRSLGGV